MGENRKEKWKERKKERKKKRWERRKGQKEEEDVIDKMIIRRSEKVTVADLH